MPPHRGGTDPVHRGGTDAAPSWRTDAAPVVLSPKGGAGRRSLEGELRAVLTEAARLSPDSKREISREIRALTPSKRLLSDSARLIRQDRDRR